VSQSALPTELDLIGQACATVGVPARGVRLLRRHANAVFFLPVAGLVLRLSAPGGRSLAKASRAVAVTRWLVGQGFPAVEPADVVQPVPLDSGVATFWRYYPQDNGDDLPVTWLATLLRRLHQLVPGDDLLVELPTYEPLQSFTAVMAGAQGLPDDDRGFLADTRQRLLIAYANLKFALPAGLIHADASTSNLLWDGDQTVLGDWDGVCCGPREQDLIITHQDARYGTPPSERQEFADRYGFDVTTWDGYPVLRDIHELHTLTSFIRLAPTDPAARAELHHRITCLRNSDHTTRWTPF
jgi:hypothetical protein